MRPAFCVPPRIGRGAERDVGDLAEGCLAADQAHRERAGRMDGNVSEVERGRRYPELAAGLTAPSSRTDACKTRPESVSKVTAPLWSSGIKAWSGLNVTVRTPRCRSGSSQAGTSFSL